MDWTMLGAIGETIGAVAVVLSLLYVGRQVRQSNSMARCQFRQEISSELNTWALGVATSPDLTASFAKVHFHGLVRDQADELERMRIAYAFTAVIGQVQLAHHQAGEGIITQDELDELFGPGTTLMKAPYLASAWPLLATAYPRDFRAWFERRYDLGGSVATDQLEA